jgi:ppGpp synthetase/RelA/SpoT-type nucleotidyltranferase
MNPADANFARNYARYVEDVIRPTQDAVHAVFRQWQQETYWESYAEDNSVVPRPVQRPRSRIKRPESLLDKFRRLAEQFPDGPTEENLRAMRDILGTRLVVYFLTHLALIDQEIRSGRHFEMHPDVLPRSYLPEATMERLGLDPDQFELKGVKPSGYASIHYAVRLLENPTASENPWFELQTRTMVEEVWSEVEHQLGYKPQQGTELSVSRQFRVIGNHLFAIDDHFDYIYDRLIYLQAEADQQDRDEDKLNAENLPRLLAPYHYRVKQGELDRLLEILDIYEVKTVADLRKRAKPEVIEAINSEYSKRNHGHRPSAFHLISTLVHLTPNSGDKHARRVLRGNLKLVDLTEWSRGPGGEPPPNGDDQKEPEASD